MKRYYVLAGLFVLSSAAFGNMLTNGDFETVDGRTGLVHGRALNALNSNWDVYTDIPGWSTASGYGIEVQASGTVVTAHSGNLYIELDSHPYGTNPASTNSSMFQSVNFGVGNYILSFYYRPRTNTLNDNGIQVRLGASVLTNVDNTTSGANGNQWTLYTTNFAVNSAGNQNLIFEATGIANQLGGFIDTVSLVRDPNTPTNEEVPEPSTYALVGGTLLAAGYLRRRK